MDINCIENRILKANGVLQPTIFRAILNLYSRELHIITAREVKDECKAINDNVDWNSRIAAICNSMRNLTDCGGKIIGEDKDSNNFAINFIIKNSI